MSDNIGFIVVHKDKKFLLEGRDRSVKIFATKELANSVCPAWDMTPIRLTYTSLCHELYNGAAFNFDEEETHARFLRRLRNDLPNKPRAAASQDRTYVRWVDAPVKPLLSPPPPVEFAPVAAPVPIEFNPAILSK